MRSARSMNLAALLVLLVVLAPSTAAANGTTTDDKPKKPPPGLSTGQLQERQNGLVLEGALGETGGETSQEQDDRSGEGEQSGGPESEGPFVERTGVQTGPGGAPECWFVFLEDQAGFTDADRGRSADAERQQARVRLDVERCTWDIPLPPIVANDFQPSLTDEVYRALPLPASSVQPGNRPMTGKPSYLDGSFPMTWSDRITLSFPARGVSAPADVTARVEEYWVDWEHDGGAVADNPGGSVTGPHSEAPRPWHDGTPGNVGWTYQRAGDFQVVVVSRWRVDAVVEGYGALDPIWVDITSAPVVVDVRQAQAVRQS